MATVASAQSGPWSDPATWSGGVLPTVGDIAQAVTGHEVTIDQDIDVLQLTNTGVGKFIVTGSTPRSINAELVLNLTATGSLLLFDSGYSAVGSSVTTPTGIVVGANSGANVKGVIDFGTGSTGTCSIRCPTMASDTSTAGGATYVVRSTGGVSVDVEVDSFTVATGMGGFFLFTRGDLTLTCASTITSSPSTSYTVIFQSPGTLVINAPSISNGAVGAVSLVDSTRNQTVIINAEISGALVATSAGAVITASTAGDITINGDVIARGSSNANLSYRMNGVYATNCKSITVNGSVTSHQGVNPSPAILMAAGSAVDSVVTINGDATSYGGPVVSVSGGTGTMLYITGSVYAERGGPVVLAPTNSTNGEVVIGKSGEQSIIRWNEASSLIAGALRFVDGASVLLEYRPTYAYTGTIWTNADSELDPADVREGVIYDSDDKVGTMAVPLPEDVYLGVPVDDTVGTASIKLADAATVTGSQISALST